MGDFKERVKYRDQDDPASKGWGEAKASPFNPNGITLSLNSGWGQAAGWGNTGFDGGMDEGGMDDFTLHSPLPALTPKPAATLINAHSLMLDSLMQGKKLAGTKYLPGQVLEDADLLTHSLALQKQADEAAGVNQTAASNLKPLLQKHQTLASSATLPQQQAWHLHKGLQLLQDARDEGIIPGEDAERLGDSFKRSLAQDQANLLLNKAPHAIAQALHTNPLLVGLNEQDRQRLEQRAERRLHSLPLDQQHQQQQALLHQTGNHLKNWFNRSYDYLGKAGQLSPSELADLELTQALPQHTLNLLAQLSAHAVKQSAKHQAYLNRIQQGFKDQPLDPHNPDDQQAADYHFLLNHGKDSDQQLAGTLPDLFRLTKIVPKSAKPALSRLVHGRDGIKFSQRLADVWQSNPSLAAQLPDEVLAHNVAASTLLPDWQLGGAADPHNRLYYLLTSPALPPVPDAWDFKSITTLVETMHQLQDDLQSLEQQAANHPDQTIRERILPLLALRRLELAQYSKDSNLPQALWVLPITPLLNQPDFIDRTLSAAADGASLLLGLPGVVEDELKQLIGPGPLEIIARQQGIKPRRIFEKPDYWRQNLFGFIPKADAETPLGRLWQAFVSGVTGGGAIGKAGMIAGGLGNLTMQSAKEAGYPEYVQNLFGILSGGGALAGLARNGKSLVASLERDAAQPNATLKPGNLEPQPLSPTHSATQEMPVTSVNPSTLKQEPIPLTSQTPLQNNIGTVYSRNNLATKKIRSLKELKRNELAFTNQQIFEEAISSSKNRSTKIGRGYQKHSNRENSTLPQINDYQQRNARAHQMLEELLNNPDLRVFERKVGNNTFIDFGSIGTHGFRFTLYPSNKLVFKGVLEPWLKNKK